MIVTAIPKRHCEPRSNCYLYYLSPHFQEWRWNTRTSELKEARKGHNILLRFFNYIIIRNIPAEGRGLGRGEPTWKAGEPCKMRLGSACINLVLLYSYSLFGRTVILQELNTKTNLFFKISSPGNSKRGCYKLRCQDQPACVNTHGTAFQMKQFEN